MLQEVNNLRLLDDSAGEIPSERSLAANEREILIEFLSGKKEATFEQIKKHFCKRKQLKGNLPESPSQLSFNLEGGGRTKISATPTDSIFQAAKVCGSDWRKMDDSTKNLIVEALTAPAATDEDIRASLEGFPALDADMIERLLKVSLPTSYGHLSVKALEKLLPFMRDGMTYLAKDDSDSALHAAGYRRRDEQSSKILDLLPSFQSLLDPDSDDYDPQRVDKRQVACLNGN